MGKTSVLEALIFDDYVHRWLMNFLGLFDLKSHLSLIDNKENYLQSFFSQKNFESELVIEYTEKNINKKNQLKLQIVNSNELSQEAINDLLKNTFVDLNQLPEKVIYWSSNDVKHYYTIDPTQHRIKPSQFYFPYIASGLTYQKDLVRFYSETLNADLEEKKIFVEHLQIFDTEIKDIIIDTTSYSEPILRILFGKNQSIPLFMMGDGIIRLFRILLEILYCSSGRLMIDEIDNGIHFSKLKEIWKIILIYSITNNTQLFISTHDSECLRAFKEVLEENSLNDFHKEVICYTLFIDKNQDISSVRYNFEEFEHAIEYSLNIRG